MIELSPSQRYRQACQKARMIGQRNLRAFLADEIPILPCSDPREFIIAEIGRAYEAGRAAASRGPQEGATPHE